MKQLRALLAIVLALAMVATACGDDDDAAGNIATIRGGDILTVGSDIPFPPFEDFEGENVVGFDAELIEEMAERNGLTVEWIDTDFDTIFTQLATARFDMVASATTITAEREQQVNFTIPYYQAQQALTINSNLTPNISGVADLSDGDSVAVQTGTTGEDWALANLASRGVDVRSFQQAADTWIALEGGQVTGVIFDEPAAVEQAATRTSLAIAEAIDTGENYGFGVDPNNQALLDAMNNALQKMIDDGTYQDIYDKWFDAPAGSVAG